MSEDKTLTKIPHFDGHYDHLSELMENLLRAKGLWSLIEEGVIEPAAWDNCSAAEESQRVEDEKSSSQALPVPGDWSGSVWTDLGP